MYDSEIDHLSNRIADEILTNFSGTAVRVLLSGGGAYHLKNALQDRMPANSVVVVPDADNANVLGGYTIMRLKQQAGR